jgi:hypothetical protein
LVLGDVEDVRRREIAQIAVLDVRGRILRGVHGRLEKSPIAQTAITTMSVDLICMDGDDFLDSQEVDVVDHFASFFSVDAWRLLTAARLSFSVGLLRWRTGRIRRLCPSVVISSGGGSPCRCTEHRTDRHHSRSRARPRHA